MMPYMGCRGVFRGIRGSVRWPGLPRRMGGPRMCASDASNGAGKRETGKKFLVTTPLYYANAAPHMGSAYPTVAADAVARYQRLQGKDVSFLTGTDEHGEKIAMAASSRGMMPLAHCDDIVELYKSLWEDLDIKYDSFVRTTSRSHELLVAEVLEKVWEKGDIYLDEYEGWYCVDCEEYKDDSEMKNNDHICMIHNKPCLYRKEENYFFKLSKYQEQIEALVLNNNTFIQPPNRKNEVIGWVKNGLKDFSISRVNVDWGVRIKRDPAHTVYVWFDALNGYISGLFPAGELASLDKASEEGWPADIHIIGKDILRFHAIFGHGFLTKDGLKMGKSLGNVLDPNALVSAYGSDAVRYFLLKEIPFGQDGDFSETRFRDVINACLANDIGNLLNRTLNLLKKNCNSSIPIESSDIPPDSPLRAITAAKVPEVASGYERLNFYSALEAILSISGRGNQFLEETAPWTAFKKGSDGEKSFAGQVLVSVLESVRIVAILLSPVTPSLCQRIYEQLGFSREEYESLTWKDTNWGVLSSGHRVSIPAPVFKRIEEATEYITEPLDPVAVK